MGLEHNLPLTKSFLWQELLLRRITNLEVDKENLVEHIEQLEKRLTQAPASRDLSTDALLVLLTRAIRAVRILSEQIESAATLTEKLVIQVEKTLLTQIEELYENGLRLEFMMSETTEDIRGIKEQIQTSTTLLIQDTYLYQEKMTADLNHLYDEQGNLQVTFSEAGEMIQRVRDMAQTKQTQLKQDAFSQREAIKQQLDTVQEQLQQLQMALHRATQAAQAICYWLDDNVD